MTRLKPLGSLTLFFPAYNDARSIADLVLRAERAAAALTDDYEIVVVNDGSQDDTAVVLARLQCEVSALRVVHHPNNRGYGGALRSGFTAARKEWVFYTDGDGQYDPEELTLLVAALGKSTDVVNGYKRRRSDSIVRVLIGSAYNAAVRGLFGLGIRDVDCDFRLIRRSLMNGLALESDSGAICVELIRRLQDAGAQFAEVGVSHYHRRHGASQFFKVARIQNTARQLLRLWWMFTLKKRGPMPQHELG